MVADKKSADNLQKLELMIKQLNNDVDSKLLSNYAKILESIKPLVELHFKALSQGNATNEALFKNQSKSLIALEMKLNKLESNS
jgi:hypothetical protein